MEPRIAVSCTSHVAYIGQRHFVLKAGNLLVLSDTETSSQELIHGVGLGIQQFCCCQHHKLLAYATEDAKPRLVLWSKSDRRNCSTLLNAEGAVLSLSISNDGTQLAVSHGYPAPAVHVYTCDNESVDVQVNPLDKNMILCQTADSSTILRCIMHGNKARLVEQKIDSTHGSTTCHAFYRMAFYQAAALHLQQPDLCGSAITAVALTCEHLLVAQEGRRQLLLCTHFQLGQVQQVVMALNIDGHSSVQSMTVGGPEHDKLLVSTTDGKQSIVYLTPSMESGVAATEVVSESHTAEVTGSCPGVRSSDVVTCSVDGRVCIWDSTSQTCVHSRAFTAKFSAITTLRQLGFIVIGSQAGVLRVVQGGPGLPVVCRSRVSDHPISQMISGMDDDVGIVACLCGATVLLSTISVGGRLCDMKMLALSGVPTALAFAHPLTGMRLLVGLTASELVCVDVTDSMLPDGPTLQERRMRLPAPIATMTCLRSPNQNSIGRMCAVFIDHMLRCYDMAADSAAWSTAKGRGMRAQDVLEIDGSIVGAQIVATASHHSDIVVASSSSGSIWKADVSSRERTPICAYIGDAAGGGVSTVSFNASGTMIVAGCKDGSIIFSTAGTPCSPEGVEGAIHQITADQAALAMDMDMADDVDEAIHLSQQPLQVLSTAGSSRAMQTSVEQNSIMFKLTALKDQLQALLQQNDQVPISEQVSRSDLVIHASLAASMRLSGELRLEGLRKQLMHNSVGTQIIRHRIGEQCQSGMILHQQTLSGIRVPTLMHSYPQRRRETAVKSLSHILFLQAVEATEWRSTGRKGMAVAFTEQQASCEHATQQNSEEDTGPVMDELVQGLSCLYSEWDQTTVRRRVTALRVIEAETIRHQSSFNSQLEQFSKQRHDAEDVLHEQGQRLLEAAMELRSMGFHPSVEDCKPVQVPAATGMNDVENFTNLENEAENEAKIHPQANSTGTVTCANCTSSSHERALKQMMNGELNSKASANMVWVLEKPDWMQQPSSEWSDEQKELAQQFNTEQKRLDEQRESRRQVLEGEMRSTRAASEELCTKIDDEMIRLLNQKRLIDQLLGELELKAIATCRGADSLMRLGLNERKVILAQGSGMQMREQTLRAAVQFVREKIAALQHSVDQQVAADRQLERSLKALLQDAEDVAPDLQAIARAWDTIKRADIDPRHNTDLFPSKAAKQDYLSVSSDIPQQGMPSNCDPGLWQKFLRWYSSKAQSSNAIVYMQAELAELKGMLDSIMHRYESVSQHGKDCIDKSHSLQQAAKKNMQDLPISLHLKNSIVEIDTVSMREEVRADALMLNVEHVSELNQVVRERGTACVNTLKEIRDFKVGIYKLLYKCKRLDMEGEDASARVRDLQLLRVTSELNQMFANPGKATKKSSIEMQQMEAQMQHNHILHKKSAYERERHSASLALQMGKKAKMNARLQEQVMSLADLMDDQFPVMESVLCKKDPDRRAKSLATTKKLQDIMRAQQKEIASIKEELHRLNLRSFPAFGNLHAPVPDVDTDGIQDKSNMTRGFR